MKTWIRGPALTLAGAAAIGAIYVGWSGSQAIYAARSRPQAIVGAVALAPAATLPAYNRPDPRVPTFAPCSSDDCSAAAPVEIAADDVLYGIEPVSEGEPWTPYIADDGFGATLSARARRPERTVALERRAGLDRRAGARNLDRGHGGVRRRSSERPPGRPEPLGVLEGPVEGLGGRGVQLSGLTV